MHVFVEKRRVKRCKYHIPIHYLIFQPFHTMYINVCNVKKCTKGFFATKQYWLTLLVVPRWITHVLSKITLNENITESSSSLIEAKIKQKIEEASNAAKSYMKLLSLY